MLSILVTRLDYIEVLRRSIDYVMNPSYPPFGQVEFRRNLL